ncbi:T9SS type A sorting domain-containing protein, partial [Flavobacteriales bacterium]|nr:T9SS type A sorting domain-containing protein [Flavobacteriales bacterium]
KEASLDGVCESCQDGVIISNDADVDGVCDADEVAGCKDEKACNYDLRSTTDRDDSLCIYPTEVYLDCSGSCLNDADADGVCDEEMGVYEFDDLGLLVYPNPTDEILYLMSEFAHEMIHVELMTITGRSISARELINIKGNTVVDLSVGHLSTGLYLLKVSNDKQSNIVPWIKK